MQLSRVVVFGVLAVLMAACAPQGRSEDQGRLPVTAEDQARITQRYVIEDTSDDALAQSLFMDFRGGNWSRQQWGCMSDGTCEASPGGVMTVSQDLPAGLYSRFVMPPTFSVEVEVRLAGAPTEQGGAGLALLNPGGDGVVLGRAWAEGQQFMGAGQVKARALHSDDTASVPSEAQSLRLRIEGASGRATCSYEQDGSWHELGSFPLPEGMVRLYLLTKGGSSAVFSECAIDVE
ncbi:MAG: hypothetical protein D6E12_14510 [Desulfovibrio sp.]|nr:MAG: hypothetical protein D6E12_14510 [Desulfovibrio sp.]